MTPPPLRTRFDSIDPILRVEDMARSVAYFVDVLGFEQAPWGNDDFSFVGRNGRGIYLCRGGQGRGGAWVWVGVDDVRALHREYAARGASCGSSRRIFRGRSRCGSRTPTATCCGSGRSPEEDA